MAIELIHLMKVRPRLDHYHRNGQMVCERCMSKLASSGNRHYDAFSEYVYVSKQLLFIFAESIFQLVSWCLSQTRENIYIANEILLIIAKFVLFASMGVGMFVAAIFPSVAGGKSEYEEELDNRYKEKKQREWEQRRKDIESGRAYDEKRYEELLAHRAGLSELKQKRSALNHTLDKEWKRKVSESAEREKSELKEYEKNRQLLNGNDLNSPKIFAGSELAEDDFLVKEINNTLKAVESGVEDPEKLRKMSEELMKQRHDMAQKDARRRELLNKYKDKDWEADRLYCDADKAFRRGDLQTGEELARRGDGARTDANGHYNEYLSV